MPHALENAYQLTSNEILDIIKRSPRCEQMVKGFVAEYHLERKLKALQEAGLLTYERIDSDGQPDFKVVVNGRTLLMECKNVMTNGYSNGDYKVDFQRTRNSPGDPLSRFYKRSDFDILAACTYNQNGKWDFLYILTSDLPLDDDVGGNCLKKAVRYHTGNIWWTTSLENILRLESVETAVSTGEVTLDRYIQ
jgi:hypothetical protein